MKFISNKQKIPKDFYSEELQTFLHFLSCGLEPFDWEITENRELIIREDTFASTEKKTKRTILKIKFEKIILDEQTIFSLEEFFEKEKDKGK